MKNNDDSLLDLGRQVSRRRLIMAGAATMAVLPAKAFALDSLYGDDGWGRDPALLPPPESEIDYPVEAQDLSKIPPEFHRQMVEWLGSEEPGTIVVDPQQRFLYLVLDSGVSAMRYGVGVGRAGFGWSGSAVIQMKRRWPRWVPPEDMIYRDERAAKWANGMPGGPENPLGARSTASTALTSPTPLARQCPRAASACSIRILKSSIFASL
jgi:hypothetical protein